jgi:hypothetical protein
MEQTIQVKNIFTPWDYALIVNYQPRSGEAVCVRGTPLYGANNILLVGDDERHTIAWLAANQIPSAANVQAALTAETAARQAGDANLQNQVNEVRNIALGASVALVFDNRGGLDAWMAANPPVPHDGYYPADLRSGWKALIREEDEPDYWWDGDAGMWRENEAKIDLSEYRTAADQDAVDALLAPLDSPHFTGVPTTPEPDYKDSTQVANAGGLLQLRTVLGVILRFINFPAGTRTTRTPSPLIPAVRITRNGRLRGIITVLRQNKI